MTVSMSFYYSVMQEINFIYFIFSVYSIPHTEMKLPYTTIQSLT